MAFLGLKLFPEINSETVFFCVNGGWMSGFPRNNGLLERKLGVIALKRVLLRLV